MSKNILCLYFIIIWATLLFLMLESTELNKRITELEQLLITCGGII